MSQQTTTATNRASVMHAVIHTWYISGLISRSIYIVIADSRPRGPRYIGATLYITGGFKYTLRDPNPHYHFHCGSKHVFVRLAWRFSKVSNCHELIQSDTKSWSRNQNGK